MEDKHIVDLYWARDDSAIISCEKKYGPYCFCIANNILANHEDSEECINDTWLHAWNSMPPQRPVKLSPFLGKITRNLALDRYRKNNAKKRGKDNIKQAIEELSECLASSDDTEAEVSCKELAQTINRFLHTLPKRDCYVFLNRYFFVESSAAIAAHFGMKEENVLLVLSRTRKKLKDYLVKEGYLL